MSEEYDVIVLGGGAIGENVADRAVQGGLTAVVIESELVGGECSYWACMPSKALLRPLQARWAAQPVRGVTAGEIDIEEVLARRDSFTSEWSDAGQVDWLRSAGIDLIRGHGRVTAEREVTITTDDGERMLKARHAVAICTGSAAALADIPGLVEAEPWTSREATSAEHVPESLAIIGGGAVAVEMATAFTGLGAQVTVIARGTLLGSMEPFAGERITAKLRERGVKVHLHTETTRVRRDADGVTLFTADGDEITAAELLVATGRQPRTDDIGLTALNIDGVKAGEYIGTDDTLLVPGTDWLYAVGDANGRALLTHQGKYQARAAGDVIVARSRDEVIADQQWGRHVATADHGAVPQVVFSEPEAASVGLTESAAREAGREIEVVDVDLGSIAGASLHAEGYEGMARMIIDTERELVLGMTFVGSDVAEMLHAATIAVVGEVPISRLWHAVPAYPTMSEVWLRLLEQYGRQSA
ncbi:PF00070 family, FAD-dependent NAD(P)-disulphide oxidoreductase [Microbacterium esteraromaticum]|uniref:PF00070 family, FAD-dependent NAD(P)-disulphide oxidoreductase n=1 Tax=Microbacterium esteraromaticum TaxID=57043 RepID=A0A1R4K2L5_9MICO|nr:NAD(P)/FAD-dependent oxidoreductase [Microbacterium esteraromaticum]SJN38315.1 PF00070 family, FAD-dependent NAD(P)-disulphide oxidoreductase [Microbacterium esteraromaticum]